MNQIRDMVLQKSKKKFEAFSIRNLLDFGSSGGGPMGYTSQGGNGDARKRRKIKMKKWTIYKKVFLCTFGFLSIFHLYLGLVVFVYTFSCLFRTLLF